MKGNRASGCDKIQTKMERNRQRYTTIGNNQIQDAHKEVGKQKAEQKQTANERCAEVKQRGEKKVDIRRMTNGEWVEEACETQPMAQTQGYKAVREQEEERRCL